MENTAAPHLTSPPREALEILADLMYTMSDERYAEAMGDILGGGTDKERSALMRKLTQLFESASPERLDDDVMRVLAFNWGMVVGREHLRRGYPRR